jgi:hypothetical protein
MDALSHDTTPVVHDGAVSSFRDGRLPRGRRRAHAKPPEGRSATGPQRRPAVAVVWAANDHLVADAELHLLHGLWPARHVFDVVEIRRARLGVPCPLTREDPNALEYEYRYDWAWQLYPLRSVPARVVDQCIR